MARPDLITDAPAPLARETLERLRPLAQRYAADRVARALGTSRQGLLAALAGLPVANRVRAAIEGGLADVEAAERRVRS
jgi:hypothetical protein